MRQRGREDFGIAGTRQERRAIWGEGHRHDAGEVPIQASQLRTRRHVPEDQLAGGQHILPREAAGSHNAAIGAETHGAHHAAVPTEAADLAPRPQVPKNDLSIGAAGQHSGAVVAEDDIVNPARVTLQAEDFFARGDIPHHDVPIGQAGQHRRGHRG